MSTIMITLSDERLLRLKELAKEAKLAPEDLIQASIEEWLSRPKDDFAQAANYVLQKPRWGLLPLTETVGIIPQFQALGLALNS